MSEESFHSTVERAIDNLKSINTVSPDEFPAMELYMDQLTTLMEDGFLERKAYGSNYQYSPAVSRKAYSLDGFHGLVNEYFDSSYSSVVLGLVEEERLSVDDLKRIIDKIENRK